MSSPVLIVAAETSSTLYAQRILEEWQQQNIEANAFGVGNQDMEHLGFERIGYSEDMAVVGFTEVIKHWSTIKTTFDRLVEEAKKRQPKLALLLDYPEFNLKLAKKLKALGIPVIYYISPQVWAWRSYRVHHIRKVVDKVLLLFPFEEEFYRKHKVPNEFVGHPLLDELSDNYFTKDYRKEHRQRYGIQESDLVLGLMPGSRNSELNHHLELQLKVAQKVVEKSPQVKVSLLVAPSLDVSELKDKLPSLDISLMVVQDSPFEMIHLADMVLCASGTATLMVGLMEKPMVVMYRMNRLTAYLAKWFVDKNKPFGMINLILGEKVVPEYFQKEASVEKLSEAIAHYLENPELRESTQKRLAQAKTKLGEKGATKRVVEVLRNYL